MLMSSNVVQEEEEEAITAETEIASKYEVWI